MKHANNISREQQQQEEKHYPTENCNCSISDFRGILANQAICEETFGLVMPTLM